jgi:DNA invertase Pin-like site-specific DNA recombinase
MERVMHNTTAATTSRKVTPEHLDKRAVVYVRQSSTHQVHHNTGSTQAQYGLAARAKALGWPDDRVEIIDEDLGKSGASAVTRSGFQRIVADVTLGHVGIVLGVDVSRLARSCRDWYQLLEVCALFRTLIGDLDGTYDPGLYNDRLLLGLKGTMSEAELHVMRQRMSAGKLAKARHGELIQQLPAGYVRTPAGQVVKEPDEQVRHAIEAVFETFERVGTAAGTQKQLLAAGVLLPARLRSGPSKGSLSWRVPRIGTVHRILRNPTYTGAFVFGQRSMDHRRKVPGKEASGKVVRPMEQWQVLLKDQHPGYITWEQYLANIKRLRDNRLIAKGTVRKGPSLCAGLVRCGHCGWRMQVRYVNNGNSLQYWCSRFSDMPDEGRCQSFAGDVLDDRIGELVLEALEPAALELSLRVAEDIAQREAAARPWMHRLERARYETQRKRRQYDAVEPENRLVARTLEAEWEEALRNERLLQEEYERFIAQRPATLSEGERFKIRALAADLPAVWRSNTTTAADRKEIIRLLIDEVRATVIEQSQQMDVQVTWQGGYVTSTTVARPVKRLEQLSYLPELVARTVELYNGGATAAQVADALNAEGWKPASRRPKFSAHMVATVLERHNGPLRRNRDSVGCQAGRRTDEWTMRDLAEQVGLPRVTVTVWAREGRLKARKAAKDGRGTWLVWADDAELRRIKEMHDISMSRSTVHVKSDLDALEVV